MNKTENSKELQHVLHILKENAAMFLSLHQEAHRAGVKKDFEMYRQKNEEKTQLLIDLQSQLESPLNNLNHVLKVKIGYEINCIATEAEKRLQVNNQLGLGIVPLNEDKSTYEKNDLEKLIYRIEKNKL